MGYQQIINFRQFMPNIAHAGVPDAAQMRSLAGAGFQLVINLATFAPGRSLLNERGIVRDLGMRYTHIPVVWEDPRPAQYDQMVRLLNEHNSGKCLVHCHLNYRASVFIFLYRVHELQVDFQEAWQDMAAIYTPQGPWLTLVEQVLARKAVS